METVGLRENWSSSCTSEFTNKAGRCWGRQRHLDMTESQEKTDIPRVSTALSSTTRGRVCVCGEDVAANVK